VDVVMRRELSRIARGLLQNGEVGGNVPDQGGLDC